MSRQPLRRDLGPERLVKQEEVKISRWQLIAEKVRDAYGALQIANRCLLVYEALQLLEPEEMQQLEISGDDVATVESFYREFEMAGISVAGYGGKIVCGDGTVYVSTGDIKELVETRHERLKQRLRAERVLGKIIRAIVKHAESMGIKVTSISVQIPGPGGAVFGRTRMVGTLTKELEVDDGSPP